VAVKGRRATRRLLLQALYQLQMTGHSTDELLDQFAAHPNYARADSDYFCELLPVIVEHTQQLDADIDAAGNIAGNQLDPVERAILWIAVAELRFKPDIPQKVVINEAIELAKEFGAEGGYRYVNGVLDKQAARSRAE
jgi:N utilization substance protein B